MDCVTAGWALKVEAGDQVRSTIAAGKEQIPAPAQSSMRRMSSQ
jgi:hypothetical protein